MSAVLRPTSPSGSASEVAAAPVDQLLASTARWPEEVELAQKERQRDSTNRYYPLGIEFKVLLFICTLALITPIAILLADATKLAGSGDIAGCLPDGTFAIPGTTNIWGTSYFLSINVPVTPASEFWTFVHAKTANVIWDLFVGRGAQIVLTFAAFHVFSKALLRLMEGEEIPFRAYSAVSFQPGGFASFVQLLAALRAPRPPEPALPGGGQDQDCGQTTKGGRRTGKARAAMITMALLTLYVAALPTLLSAMNGYYAVAIPSLSYYPTLESMKDMSHLNSTQIPCDIQGRDDRPEGMVPAWGVVLDAARVHTAPNFLVLEYPPDPFFEAYYYYYKDAYDAIGTDSACAGAKDTSYCPATNIQSNFMINQTEEGPFWALSWPLLNIQVFPPFNTMPAAQKDSPYTPSPSNMPSAWACGNHIFQQEDFSPQTRLGFNFPNVTGTCTTGGGDGGGYRWGFSYHLLILVCVLNLAAAAAFSALWVYGAGGDAAGTRRGRERSSVIGAAAEIVGQARRCYGEEAVDGTWTAGEMEERIFRGRGMRILVEGREGEGRKRR